MVNLVREIVTNHGHADAASIETFFAAGYSHPQILKILLGVSLMVMSHSLEHVSPVEIDGAFAGEANA